ncbi:MAG: hypothetical protein C0169_00260 [Thermodesulfobacterium geofontis]|uniref:Uncharacterized protein n=1 Tax=Thermodesulfobacterium geofontis TaxID=1295609 RepID=A0A2N7QGT1_9BACT|nr:MAG: hypothetical protein C0169_00260 [Thermodesulfobacterium geofontis]
MSKVYKVIEKGEEKIGELKCNKKELRDENILIQIAWISERYKIPLKLLNYIQNKEHTKFEIKNIKEEAVKEEPLRIPPGYKKEN